MLQPRNTNMRSRGRPADTDRTNWTGQGTLPALAAVLFLAALGLPVCNGQRNGTVPKPPPPAVPARPVGPQCHLLSHFAILIQLLLALLSLSALVYKRHREHPPRPWAVWFLDTSKQVAGQTLMHTSNLLVGWLFGRASLEERNPCVWYFVNFMLDTTLGVGIVWVYLTGLTALFTMAGVQNLKTGDYGPGPRPDLGIWFKQLLVFSACLMGMKGTVVVMTATMPIWVEIGGWVLSWVPGERGQLVVVMFVAPVIMNIFQFWLVDTVIKNKTAPTVASSEDYLPTTDSYIPFPPDQPVYFKLSEDQPQETGVKMGMRNGFRFPESRVSYDARLNSAAAEEDDDEEAEQPGVNGEAPLSAGSGSGSGSGSGQFGR